MALDHPRRKVVSDALVTALRIGSPQNRLLRAALGVLALVPVVLGLRYLLTEYWPYVDIEIPLRAADRWVHGGAPYLASAFAAPPGYDLPFLYPPPVLPLLAPLLALPRPLVWAVWSAACLGAAVFACRRLGIPGRWIPLVLCWPPFAEGILGGNVQIILFGAFVAVFWDREGGRSAAGARGAQDPIRAQPRDPRTSTRPAPIDGLLAGIIPALKASVPHPWLALLRRRPGSALAGLLVLGGIAGLCVPLLGLDLWRAWLEQLGRASDPAWPLPGGSLAHAFPAAVQLMIAMATGLLCLVVPSARLGAWTGLLAVIGAPSLRMYGVVFALPAFLVVRREIGLICAALVATYTFHGLWLAVPLVTAALVLADPLPMILERTDGPTAVPDTTLLGG